MAAELSTDLNFSQIPQREAWSVEWVGVRDNVSIYKTALESTDCDRFRDYPELGDKVESPWGRHLIPQIDADTVIDLALMSGGVQGYLANQVR